MGGAHTSQAVHSRVLSASSPHARSAPCTVEASWWWSFPQVFLAPSLVVYSVSGFLKNRIKWVPKPQTCLAFGTSCTALCAFFGMLCTGVANVPTLFWEMFCAALAQIVLASVFMVEGPWFVIGLWIYSLMDIVSWGILLVWYYNDFFSSVSLTGLMVMFLSISITVGRQRALRGSVRLLNQDRQRYDELWISLYSSEDGKACIDHLEKVVRMIGLDDSNYCRQHNRLRADTPAPQQRKYYTNTNSTSSKVKASVCPLFDDLGWVFVSQRQGTSIRSLNQLYTSGAIANLLLRESLCQWAAATQGMMEVRGDDGAEESKRFVNFTDIKNDAEMVQRVKWTDLKRHDRAIEKLMRSYAGEPSKLLDIARNCLIFETIDRLTNALGNIVTDSNVRVQRIKNCMSPRYSSAETGGYRDVCINLQIVNKQAEALGAELHMCEVQLLLLDFAQLKTAEGHRRYVRARNESAM